MKRFELRAGDSLHLLRTVEDNSVDMLLSDPPYSSGGFTRGDRTRVVSAKYQQSGSEADYPEFYGDNRDQRGFLAWASLWLADAWRAVKDGGTFAIASDWRMLPTMTDAVQAGGFVWRGIVPWHKPACRPQLGRFAAACEYWIWGSKGPLAVERDVPALPGLITCNTVPGSEREHVTEKPEEVMQKLARFCAPGGLILDPFLGSGTTGVAALMEGRRFLGFELAGPYFDIARRRLEEYEALGARGSAKIGQGSLFAATEDRTHAADDFG